jgi:hypothetical protein
MTTTGFKVAPAVGFEPTTKWLTATYSTIELRRNSQKRRTKYMNNRGSQHPEINFLPLFMPVSERRQATR